MDGTDLVEIVFELISLVVAAVFALWPEFALYVLSYGHRIGDVPDPRSTEVSVVRVLAAFVAVGLVVRLIVQTAQGLKLI